MMTPQDRLELQNWIRACEQAIDALAVFKSWLKAWETHPKTGELPCDLVDQVIDDLKKAGLETWVYSQAMWTLKKILCGESEK